jgi:hypothetical protein
LPTSVGLTEKIVVAIKMLYPSGSCRATYSVAMMVLAPALFSTTTGLPQMSSSLRPSTRASVSLPPPGA